MASGALGKVERRLQITLSSNEEGGAMVNYENTILKGDSGLTRYDAMDLVYAAVGAILELVETSKSPESERLSNALRIAIHLLYKTTEDD